MSFTPPKPKPLPPTSAKTPVGKAPKKPAPKQKAPADPYGVMASLQPALQALNDQQAQQTESQNQQRQAIQQATNEFLKYVTGQPSVQSDYANAANQEAALGSAAAAYLKGQNPNDQIQAELAKELNPEQVAQVSGQLGGLFNNGAAALFGTRGLIPGSTLAENGAAAAAFQKAQAPNVALQGLRGLRQFAYDVNQANQALAQKRADLFAQIPSLTQKAQADAASLAAKTAYQNASLAQRSAYENALLGFDQSRIGLEGTRIQNQAGQFSARQQQQQDQFIARQKQQIAEFNARQKTAAAKLSVPSSALSKSVGYLVDGTGRPILGPNGQKQILPGYKANANGAVTKVGSAGGGLTASSVQSFVRSLAVTKRDTKTGKTMLYPDGTPVVGHKMPYLTAYKYLRSRGVGDADARTALDTTYRKGQDGRSWLTNEEQAALARVAHRSNQPGFVGLQSNKAAFRDLTRVHIGTGKEGGVTYRGGYLTPNQYAVLQRAGLAPAVHPGAPGGGYWIDPNG